MHLTVSQNPGSPVIAHVCSGSVNKGHVFFVHADLLDYADNDGNLSHRDLECCRQYICWAGNLDKAFTGVCEHFCFKTLMTLK